MFWHSKRNTDTVVRVLLYSSEHYGGCGHALYLLIGPNYPAVLKEIFRDPTLRDVVEERSSCRACGAALRGVIVNIPGPEDMDMVKTAHRGYECEFKFFFVDPQYVDEPKSKFTRQEIARAQEEVLWKPFA